MGSKTRLQWTRKLSRRITKTSYKTSPGYSAIHTEADVKTNRNTTNPLPEVRARAWALVRRGLTEGCLVGQVAVRGVSPSGPPQPTTTVGGWPEARLKLCCERKDCFFLVIVLGENCQVTPVVTHAVPRSDVTSQGQVSRIIRTGTLGALLSSFPAPTVKKEPVRADMAKNQCLDNFVTPCRASLVNGRGRAQTDDIAFAICLAYDVFYSSGSSKIVCLLPLQHTYLTPVLNDR